jgi:3-hydroxyisobutyrate dehydrogenase-like beta-hydroxyacid dehydrogenase
MGPAGAGLQAKLARNIIQYGSWLAAYEGQRLAEAAGIELSKLALAVRESDKLIGGSSRLMFRETVEPFAADAHPVIVDAMRAGAGLAHKDLRAALELAGELGVELPMTVLTEELCNDVFGLGKSEVDAGEVGAGKVGTSEGATGDDGTSEGATGDDGTSEGATGEVGATKAGHGEKERL